MKWKKTNYLFSNMNDYKTAKQYLAALKNELLTGQKTSLEQANVPKDTSTEDNKYKSLNTQLISENEQLKEQIQNLQNELELIRGANGDVVNKYNQEIETLKSRLEEEQFEVDRCQKDNGLYVSLDSILEWAAEQHKDSKDVTLIQNMIYDRFELTKKGKELVRKLAVDELRQIIVQHADQVIGIAEKDSSVIHTKKR